MTLKPLTIGNVAVDFQVMRSLARRFYQNNMPEKTLAKRTGNGIYE